MGDQERIDGILFKKAKIFRVYGLSNKESLEIEEELKLYRLGALTNCMSILINCSGKIVIFEKSILYFWTFHLRLNLSKKILTNFLGLLITS